MAKMQIEIDVPNFDDADALREAIIDAYVAKQLPAFANMIADSNASHTDDRGLSVTLQRAATERVLRTIDDHVAKVIGEISESPFIPTDKWGQRKGEPVTLRELMANAATRWLEEKVNQHGNTSGYDNKISRIEWLAHKTAEEVFKSDLAATVAQIKATIQANIQARVGNEIAQAVARLLSPATSA